MSDLNNDYYQVTNAPTDSKKPLFSFGGNQRKKGGFLAMAILGVYIIAGGVIGWIALNQGQDGRQAQASIDQNAILVASIRLLEDKNYNIGDNVDLFLTIQNPNLVTAVSDLKLQMQSAGDSVVWENAHSGALLTPDLPQFSSSNSLNTGITPNGDIFALSDMAPSERVEYLIRGKFVKETSDYLAISAKLDFINPEGAQSINTNRVFTSLSASTSSQKQQITYNLRSSKDKLQAGEKFSLTVTRIGEVLADTPSSGNVQITSIKTGEVVLDKTCSFTQDSNCEVSVDVGIPQGGLFSSIFKDTNGTTSNILNISVVGTSTFTVSKLASLTTPLGTTSINGVLPVYVKNVIDANSKLTGDETCVASILDKDSKLVSKLESKVNLTSKQCYFLLSDLTQSADNSNFYFTLEGTNITQSITLSKKQDNLLLLTSSGAVSDLRPGSSLNINASLKNDPDLIVTNSPVAQPIINSPSDTTSANAITVIQGSAPAGTENIGKLTVWNVDSGDVKDYYQLDNKKIAAQDGILNYTIPENFFNKEGLYKIKVSFDNNQNTDWLNVSFGANSIGFVTSYSSALNADSLVAGNNMDFVVNGLLDKKGNQLSTTDQCNAGIWSGLGDINEPLLAQGAASGNQCVSSIASQSLAKTGPVTLAYTGKSNSLELPQAIQFNVKPNVAAEYGDAYLAYSPAIVGFSNTILVGPVSDKYGNLADKANLVLEAKIGETVILNQDVVIQNGYAQVLIPSSSITQAGDLKVTLSDKNNKKQYIDKSFKVLPPSDNQKIIIPNFPATLNGDEDLKIGLTGLESVTLSSTDKCVLNVIKNSKEKLKVENNYDKATGSCNFKLPLGNLRNDSHLILTLQLGQFSFGDVTEIQAGEAANFFRLFPLSVLDPKEGVIAELASTPILDRMGSPVNGYLAVTLNGRDRKVRINNGFAKISLEASQFQDKDFKTNLAGQKYLEIVIDAKASNNSISSTNSVQIFLGDQSLSNTKWEAQPSKASNYAQADKQTFLEYTGNTCEVYIGSLTEPTMPIASFYSQNKCLVEVNKPAGEYQLSFMKRGQVVYSQNLSVQSAYQNIDLSSDTQGYKVKITSPSLSDIGAQINDNGRIYNYTPDKTTGIISVSQAGLDASKTYLLEISYKDHTGGKRVWFREANGAKLVENNN